jgi:hypothetical protein
VASPCVLEGTCDLVSCPSSCSSCPLALPACFSQPEGIFPGECSDGEDNDGDGTTDCRGESECAEGDTDTDSDADSADFVP